jgi:hypothetical protein
MDAVKSGCLAAMLALGSVVPATAQYYSSPYSVWNAPNLRAHPWVNTIPLPMPYNVGPQLSHESAQSQVSLWWWCPAAHAYYPQVTFCQIGTWEAVYPPPTSPPQVSQSPPSRVTEKPVTGNEQFRCRDPNTNFVYERPEPCAKGDETLSRFASSPAASPPTSPPQVGQSPPSQVTEQEFAQNDQKIQWCDTVSRIAYKLYYEKTLGISYTDALAVLPSQLTTIDQALADQPEKLKLMHTLVHSLLQSVYTSEWADPTAFAEHERAMCLYGTAKP